MNEHRPDPEPEIDPEIDPGQDAQVRALLGEVGAEPEPIPAEVSARLDDTLAMLRAERVLSGEPVPSHETPSSEESLPSEEPGNVVPLRRRWLPRAAGAAAAVIVLGVGGLAAVRLGTDNPQDSAASGGAASDTSPLSPAPSEAPVPSTGAAESPGSKARALRESAGAVRALPAVTTDSFDADVAALLRRGAVVTPGARAADPSGDRSGVQPTDEPTDEPGSTTEGSEGSEGSGAVSQGRAGALLRGCPGPAVTDGAVANPVRIDGELAVLLVHPAKGGEQLVDAWTCQGDRLGSTQLTGGDVTP